MELLNDYKKASQPVAFVKLSPSTNGIFFFNSFRGSRIENSTEVCFAFNAACPMSIQDISKQTVGTFDVLGCVKWLNDIAVVETSNGEIELREAILYDHTGHIKFTVWNNLIASIKETTWYNFTNLNIKLYYGCKLSTTKSTQVTIDNNDSLPILPPEVMQEYLKDQELIEAKNIHKLCCPEITNLELQLYPGCANVSCKKPLVLQPGARIVTCPHCKRSMRSDKCKSVLHCLLTFEEDNPLNLLLPKEVLEKYMEVDVIEMGNENIDDLKEKILFFENVDYTYSSNNVITSMQPHI